MKLFAPAVRFMGGLRLTQKFLALGILAGLATAWVTYILIGALNEGLVFANQELRGVAYLQAATALHQAVLGQEAALLAGSSAAPAVEGALARLEAVDQSLGRALRTGDQVAALRSGWKAAGALGPAERDKALAASGALADAVLALVSQVGDSSNLILDPDGESYYIMDLALTRLPG